MKREGGQTMVETIFVALILFVPLFWLMGVLSDLHRGALAAASASRDAGSEISRSPDLPSALSAAESAAAHALRDLGLDPGEARVDVSAPRGVERGARVSIRVSIPIAIAQAPLLGESTWGPEVWVSSSYVATVDRYSSRP